MYFVAYVPNIATLFKMNQSRVHSWCDALVVGCWLFFSDWWKNNVLPSGILCNKYLAKPDAMLVWCNSGNTGWVFMCYDFYATCWFVFFNFILLMLVVCNISGRDDGFIRKLNLTHMPVTWRGTVAFPMHWQWRCCGTASHRCMYSRIRMLYIHVILVYIAIDSPMEVAFLW